MGYLERPKLEHLLETEEENKKISGRVKKGIEIAESPETGKGRKENLE